jgi:hypothetical protein
MTPKIAIVVLSTCTCFGLRAAPAAPQTPLFATVYMTAQGTGQRLAPVGSFGFADKVQPTEREAAIFAGSSRPTKRRGCRSGV